MGTLITIWLVVMLIYYISMSLFRSLILLPKAIYYIVCLPAMPFIVAYRNKEEQPKAAKAIYWLWGSLLSIIIVWAIVDICCS
ncbi:MAG: hypothetical protein RR908_03045 [Rikenellaceae bacterium]